MLWEILVSNLITTCIVGGGITIYHFYRLKKEQEYYEGIKNKIADSTVIFIQCIVSYMALKGYSEVATLKAMLENNPVFKNKILPWAIVDGLMQPAVGMGQQHDPYDNMFDASPLYDTKYKFGMYNAKLHKCKSGLYKANPLNCDTDSEDSNLTESCLPKMKQTKTKTKKSKSDYDTLSNPVILSTPCDFKIEI